MSERKVPRSVEQRIVIKFLVGENAPSAEIHHKLQQQYVEECLLRRHSSIFCQLFFLFYMPSSNWPNDLSELSHECLLFEIQLKCIFCTPLLCNVVYEYIITGYSTVYSLWFVVYHFDCCAYYHLHCYVHCLPQSTANLMLPFDTQ